MRPDKNTVNRLLALSDEELLSVIKKLCADNNVDTSTLKLGMNEMRMLRAVLMNASDSDIESFLKYFAGGRNNG